jgi:hypothetical protein
MLLGLHALAAYHGQNLSDAARPITRAGRFSSSGPLGIGLIT